MFWRIICLITNKLDNCLILIIVGPYKRSGSTQCKKRLFPHLCYACRAHGSIILYTVHNRKRGVPEISVVHLSCLIPIKMYYSPSVIYLRNTIIPEPLRTRIELIRAPVQKVDIVLACYIFSAVVHQTSCMLFLNIMSIPQNYAFGLWQNQTLFLKKDTIFFINLRPMTFKPYLCNESKYFIISLFHVEALTIIN